jgi:hypothetical protein
MTNAMSLPQGSLELLTTDAAQDLLRSNRFARFAYSGPDGLPRIVPTWFHWTGAEFVMPTFVSAPHVHQPAARLRDLRARPHAALTIDTDDDPPTALSVRGTVSITEHPGVVAEFAVAAKRYMGEDAAAEYMARLDDPRTSMARVALTPTWVGLIDFQTRLPAVLGGITA